MRRTYGKNFLRTVKETFGRFAAIFAIVALGVGFLAGLLSSTPDMRYSFDKYFDDSSMYDIRVLGSLGLKDGDVAALRALDGVENVQAGYIADVLMSSGKDNDYTARLHSFELRDGMINRPELTSGRFPEKSGECVIVNVPLSSKSKLNIGDTLTVSEGDENADALLNTRDYTVVGFADYCPYFSGEKEYTNIGAGTVDIFLLVSESNFSTDFYTDVYVTAAGAGALTSLTSEYQALVDKTAEEIESISNERGNIRYSEFMSEASQKLSDAKADYADAENEANTEFADARQQLADGREQLSGGEAQLADAWEQISKNEKTLTESEGTLDKQERDMYAELADAVTKLYRAQNEIDINLSAVDESLASTESELDSYALSDKQQNAFDALRKLPVSYPSLADDLQTLSASSERLAAIGARLTEIGAMSAEGQAKYADEAAGLIAEKNALQANIGKIMSGDAYAAFARGTAELAITGADSQKLPALAVKLGSLDAAKAALNKGQAELDARRAEFDTKKSSAENEISEARAKLADGKAELETAKDKYYSELGKLNSLKIALSVNENKYEDAKAEAESSLADAKQQIADSEAKLTDTKEPSWQVYIREQSISYGSITANIDKVNAIAKVFPFFFFLVAALVALTTMTRMVDDERLQIGTMKALGYSHASIMWKYILYALSASVLGSIVGVTVGFRLFPWVIWNAYTMMYELPEFYYPVNWAFAIWTSGAVILCVLLATFNACRSTLKEKPAQLMLVKAPDPGKRVLLERITPIWKRMKFTHKVTARNLFRYKKRFLMTTIGVAGCTALLVAGFGLHDSFSDIPDRQFGVLQTFDIMAPYAEQSDLNNEALQAILGDSDNVAGSISVSYESANAETAADRVEVYTFISENVSDLDGFVTLRERTGGNAIDFADGSVIITEKASEILKVKVGDTISLTSKDGNKGSFRITGICENYLRNYLYMTESTYEAAMGQTAEQNLLLIRLTESGQASGTDLGKSILASGAVSGISYTANTKDAFATAINKIDTIVAVIILSAGALALVVLYNLTNINISERVKEIATIKVLGFTDREVNSYINRESIILSLIGTVFGLVLGVFLHRYIVDSAELDSMMFGRNVKALSFVFSAALTMAFSVLVDLFMRRKLRKISMVESMKAPE